ncbi:MAG: 2-amino-4-hydroxy-6-hydroxymethyldihydropteridine diphosphokinase, partial [Woeseia sp.]|nr:2-amino-4-hydroxy-6-hydroxymethyldihydropteridine diphosphokinase [Woeseia sp.]
LDIDLLLYDDLIRHEPPVRLPRDDVLAYAFVLGPLVEIAPDYVHPQTGKSLQSHWDELDKSAHPLNRDALIL